MKTDRHFANRLTALPFVEGVDLAEGEKGKATRRMIVHTPRGNYPLAVETQRTALSYALIERSLRKRKRQDTGASWILLAPYVSPQMSAYLVEKEINFLDEVGNCRLQLDDAYIALIEGRKPPRRPVLQEGIRAPGYQVLFALLAKPALLRGTVREIAAAAGVGKTTAAKMIRRLREEQLIGRSRLLRPSKLVDRWLIAYADIVRPHLFVNCYRTADSDPTALADRIESILAREELGGVWSGGAALDRITGWYRGRSTVLHLPKVPTDLPRILRALPARDGDFSVLRLPGPVAVAGVVPNTAHPFLVYSELMTQGDERAREMAHSFQEEHLKEFV